MSGTSLDGVDIACCRFQPQFELMALHHLPMPAALLQSLLSLQAPTSNELDNAMRTSWALADWYAEGVSALLQRLKIDSADIQAIGCHGQTIRHRPADHYTVQLNAPARLAEQTKIDVVADFRSRDIAAGGQGAPLVPAFHRALFAHSTTHRAILNIGGMANLTNLPPNGEVSGFDCGPGNVLMDSWANEHLRVPFDEDGRWAASGKVIPDLLRKLGSHSFFALSPPKSCGREEFNLGWLKTQLDGSETPADVQATLCELTADVIAASLELHCQGATELYVCGGGAKNDDLMMRLRQRLPEIHMATTEALGLAVDAVEAAAFAWLAQAFVERQAGNLPAVTGAQGPRILGALYPA